MRREHRHCRLLPAGQPRRMARHRRGFLPRGRGRAVRRRTKRLAIRRVDGTTTIHRFAVRRSRHPLQRNTTWTMSRDTGLGLNFVGINFYDGQGFMVAKKRQVKSAKQLSGATSMACSPARPRELNLADYFRANNLEARRGGGGKNRRSAQCLFCRTLRRLHDRCFRSSSWRGLRAQPIPADHVILPEVISKELFGPAVRHGDDHWFDVVKWSLVCND